MKSNVIVPEKRDDAAQLLPTVIGTVGSFFGPVGSAVGSVAGAAGAFASQNKPAPQVPQTASVIDRRIDNLQQQAMEQKQLMAAADAVKQLPAEQRMEYEPPIQEALRLSQQKYGRTV